MNIENYMTYDKTSHRWVLTEKVAELIPHMKTIYRTAEEIEYNLNKQSSIVYNWIYSQAPQNKLYNEYILAKAPTLKQVMFDALMAFLEADAVGGSANVASRLGADLQGGHAMDRGTVRELAVPESVKVILENGDGIHNLIYAGYRMPCGLPLYEQEDY